MKYVGEFTSLYDKRYKVEIITNYDTTKTKEITLAADPVTITTESDGLFAPIKSRSCSITIVSNEVYFDMYAASAKQNTVTVYKQWIDPENPNNKVWEVFFEGYVTPGVYDQSWTYMDQFTIECCDKLSILQYYKYEYDDYVNKGEQHLSLKRLIIKCLNVAEYSNTYFRFPKYSSMYSRTDDTCFLDLVTVSEANFFDDDDEHTPWTYEDVLTEICNFLGVSCCVWHEMIYFVDYQLINKYDKQMGSETFDNLGRYYGFNNSTYGYMELTEKPITLTKDDMMGNKPSLSLDAVYNKISVSCSLYDYGDGDEESLGSTLLNYDNLTNLCVSDHRYNGAGVSYNYLPFTTIVQTKDSNTTYECEVRLYRPDLETHTAGKWHWRYFESNLYNDVPNDGVFHYYDRYTDYGRWVDRPKQAEYTTQNDKAGCWSPMQFDSSKPAGYEEAYWLIYEGYQEENIKKLDSQLKPIPPQAIYKNVAIPLRVGTIKRNSTDVNMNFTNIIMFTPYNRNISKQTGANGKPVYYDGGRYGSWDYNATVKRYIEESNCKPNLTFLDTTDVRYSPNAGTAYITFKCLLLYQPNISWKEKKKLYSCDVWNDLNMKPYNSLIPCNEFNYGTHLLAIRSHTASPNSDDYNNFNKGWECLKLEISCGDKYWDGSTWTTTPSTFTLSFHDSDMDMSNGMPDDDEKASAYKWLTLVKNTNYKQNLSDKDVYAIPITKEDNLFGKLKVVIYTPKMPKFPNNDTGKYSTSHAIKHGLSNGSYYVAGLNYQYFPQHIFMKDMTLAYEYSTEDYNADKEEESDDDIVYSNVINESYVEEYDDLELKINTQVDKKPQSRSYALDARTTEYVHNLYCPATGHNYRPEENLIEKLYNHYSTPKKIFDMKSIFNDELHPASPVIYTSISDKPLCVDSQEIHLANDTNDIKLIEF